VPVRAGPVFAVALMVTSEVPVPLPLDAMTIHETRETAVQTQNSCVVTATCSSPPAAPVLRVAGPTEISQVLASCAISARWPFTAMAPARVAVVRFGAAENGIVPEPCPLVLDMSVSHGTSAVAVHWHSRAVSTVIAPVPPPDAIVAAEAWTDTAHRALEGAVIEVEEDAPQAARSGRSRHDSRGPQVRIGFAKKQCQFQRAVHQPCEGGSRSAGRVGPRHGGPNDARLYPVSQQRKAQQWWAPHTGYRLEEGAFINVPFGVRGCANKTAGVLIASRLGIFGRKEVRDRSRTCVSPSYGDYRTRDVPSP
jgi:hypothetical protein